MSLENFWFHFQMPSSLLQSSSAVDTPRLDSKKIESLLDDSDFWLMHASVKGYEPEDFCFLGDSEKANLTLGVEQFREVSLKARNGGEISEAERNRAKQGLQMILEIIRPDKYADIDAFVIGKKIENQVREDVPGWVKEMVFETGTDVGGDPALWIWVEVEDSAAEDEAFRDRFSSVRETLKEAAARVCPERWLYSRVRTVSEQRPLAKHYQP